MRGEVLVELMTGGGTRHVSVPRGVAVMYTAHLRFDWQCAHSSNRKATLVAVCLWASKPRPQTF